MNARKKPTQAQSGEASYEGAVYYRARSILLLAPTLNIGPKDNTHKRKSIRLLIGCRLPVSTGYENGERLEGRAILINDHAGLCDIRSHLADVVLVDVMPATPEYVSLSAFLGGKRYRQLDSTLFSELFPRFLDGQDGSLRTGEVAAIISRCAELVTGTRPKPLQFDSRIERALELMEQLPLTEIDLKRLSKEVHLSTDRFRHLFKEATGSTVSQYARNAAMWKALKLIEENYTNTAASHSAGFHDASHFYRVYMELFGVSLCERSNPRKFRRVRCFN